jgi:hypothetical protein
MEIHYLEKETIGSAHGKPIVSDSIIAYRPAMATNRLESYDMVALRLFQPRIRGMALP